MQFRLNLCSLMVINNLQIYFQIVNTSLSGFQRMAVVFVVLATWIVFPLEVQAQKGSKIRTVVIDPGHGGRDPGAVGKYSKEKDIVLDVALKTGQYIRQNLPDVKVIYTRSKDEFIELHRRAAIANENNADVFISIHCNAARDTKVYGAETFVMGEHRTQANLEVAKLENAAILLEDNASEEYGGFDPNSTAAYIALSLYQSENKNQSIRLAQNVQDQFTKRLGRKDRSVQQAGFLVLYRTSMPSILVELGFITNPEEEAFMMSEEGKVYLASAIYRAFRDYKTQFERENAGAPSIPEEWKEELARQAANPPGNINNPNTVSQTAQQNTAKPASTGTTNNKPAQTGTSARQNTSTATQASNTIVYKVQFATFPSEIPLNHSRFKGIEAVEKYFHDGMHKYTSGSFRSFNEAVQHQRKIRGMGYSDAFVVAFSNSQRIKIDEAMRISPQ